MIELNEKFWILDPEDSQFAGLRIVKYHVEIEIQILRSNSIQMSVLPFWQVWNWLNKILVFGGLRMFSLEKV